jgi:hypothetical protein
MGKLVEQTLRTMYQGVSRQPDTVRLPGQVEEAENVLFSVVSGGFTKRPGTQFVADVQLDPVDATDHAFHSYERDTNEKYLIVIGKDTNDTGNGGRCNIAIFDPSGTAYSLTAGTTALEYLSTDNPSQDLSFATTGDVTFIANKLKTVLIYEDGTFHHDTMPHQLVREADGTFSFQMYLEWGVRPDTGAVGAAAEAIIPSPDFVGKGISDITFFRNRFSFVSDETVFFSASGDYVNFWPKTEGQVIDSDPFGRTASSSQVNKLRHVVAFRKALFCSAESSQFELSGDPAVTPTTTTIDVATQYTSEPLCRPIGFRDELYFASRSGSSAVLFEYFYSDKSVGHTASDVLIHASDYIPAPITCLVGDTVTGTVLALSGTDRSTIYVYKTYWDGENKAQSAWGKWTFGSGSVLHNLTITDGDVFILISRNGILSIEKMSLNAAEKPTNFKYPLRLDALQYIVGAYDSVSNTTTYTSAFPVDATTMSAVADSVVAPIGSQGSVITPISSSGNSFVVGGDKSGTPIYLGFNYNMSVELSKQYLREGDNQATVTTGRLQLKRMYFDYKDTAFLQVVVTPDKRPAKTFTFNGTSLGTIIEATPELLSGVFDAPIRSDGSTVTIKITNPSYMPCTITSARWVGFFNEMTRQE